MQQNRLPVANAMFVFLQESKTLLHFCPVLYIFYAQFFLSLYLILHPFPSEYCTVSVAAASSSEEPVRGAYGVGARHCLSFESYDFVMGELDAVLYFLTIQSPKLRYTCGTAVCACWLRLLLGLPPTKLTPLFLPFSDGSGIVCTSW